MNFKQGWSGLRFSSLTYKNEYFESQPCEDFLKNEFERETKLLNDIGNRLNISTG